MRIRIYQRKRQKGENMTNQKKYPGTPVYHNLSARRGRQATNSVTRLHKIPKIVAPKTNEFCQVAARGIPAIMREEQNRLLRTGFMLGFAIAAALFGLILWLWVIPTMDAAVATAQGMVA